MRVAALVLLGALAAPAFAQSQQVYQPQPFQAGKDVVWVPTPQALVDKLLDLAQVTKDDFVMDLGSGDGRTVITAAKRGARALGVEYNTDLVELSRRNAEKEGVGGRAVFVDADLFATDLSQATVITMFLLLEINLRLRPKILALKPGTRIASNTFTMNDWLPEESVKLTAADGCNSAYCTALFWIVPARIAGTHKLPEGEITITQEFQLIAGTLTIAGKTLPFSGRVRGLDVSFEAGGKDYRGKWNGTTLELLQLIDNPGEAEAREVVAVVGVVPVARRGAGEARHRAPGSTATDALRAIACEPRRPVRGRPRVARVPAVVGPLPDIAEHVV